MAATNSFESKLVFEKSWCQEAQLRIVVKLVWVAVVGARNEENTRNAREPASLRSAPPSCPSNDLCVTQAVLPGLLPHGHPTNTKQFRGGRLVTARLLEGLNKLLPVIHLFSRQHGLMT